MAPTFEESVHEGFKEFEAQLADVGKTQQLLGDYMDAEFKKILDNQAKKKKENGSEEDFTSDYIIKSVGGAVRLSVKVAVSHYFGSKPSAVMTMQPACAGKLA